MAIALALLALAGCGGSAPATPEGFSELSGDGWTLAHPSGWEVSDVGAGRLAQGPEGTGGLAPQAAVARDDEPPPFELSVDAFKADQTLRRGDWKITKDADFELDGASHARVIEADYLEATGESTTPVRTIDLLVRTGDGVQLDFLMRAPKADFERVRLDEVLDTIRLK